MKQSNDDFAKQFEETVINITKASAYDIMKENYEKVIIERDKLKADLDAIMDELCNMDTEEVAKNPSQLVGRLTTICSNFLKRNL